MPQKDNQKNNPTNKYLIPGIMVLVVLAIGIVIGMNLKPAVDTNYDSNYNTNPLNTNTNTNTNTIPSSNQPQYLSERLSTVASNPATCSGLGKNFDLFANGGFLKMTTEECATTDPVWIVGTLSKIITGYNNGAMRYEHWMEFRGETKTAGITISTTDSVLPGYRIGTYYKIDMRGICKYLNSPDDMNGQYSLSYGSGISQMAC
jgi:hypothetical protein